MNAIRISLLFAALCLASAPAAQAQQPPPNPTPATSETEGTAADRTPPNPSATRPIQPGQTQVDPQTDPRPSTNPAEGTAADRTPPGRTSTTSGATAQLVGAAVVTPSGAPIGKVVDVVFDSVAQQPAFVVIASENGQAAVPYSVASSMKSGGKVVIDKSRLKSAPKVKDGEWRNETGSHWQQESARYWEQSGG